MGSTHEVEAVASGILVQIERWGSLLQKVGIDFEIRKPCEDHAPAGNTHAELWVERDRVEQARSIICRSARNGTNLMW